MTAKPLPRPRSPSRAGLLLLLASLGCASHRARGERPDPALSVPAQDREPEKAFAREGLYVGFQTGALDIYGDFDGDTSLVDDPMMPTSFVLIPDLDAGAVYGISVAYRWKRYEIAVVVGGSEHDGTFQGASGFDTEIRHFDLLFKQYWWIGKPIQPYVVAGLGVSEATIDNGATDQMVTADAMLEDGVSLDFGAGLALYAGPWASVYGQALWRFSSFETADGIGGELPISEHLDSDSLELTVGVSLRILRGHD
jgi:hypothetical protein